MIRTWSSRAILGGLLGAAAAQFVSGERVLHVEEEGVPTSCGAPEHRADGGDDVLPGPGGVCCRTGSRPRHSSVRSQPVRLLKLTPVLRAAMGGGGTQGSLLSVTPNPVHGGWANGELNSTGQWSDPRFSIRDARICPVGGSLDTA
ncbi:hypothetical protein ACFRMQ_34910 [Kitasatospora sp. NPDC056783]|uniref:hypothetical protein n=1 Tax=Kitasatospora sp. NPDC056783 TaxID=3345943 RepID=UPI0036A4B41C